MILLQIDNTGLTKKKHAPLVLALAPDRVGSKRVKFVLENRAGVLKS